MREIKFRVYNFDKQRMEYGPNIIVDYESGTYKAVILAVSNSHLMQFTGLQDMHGVDIYEGDIIDFRGLKYKVSFKEGSFVTDEDSLLSHINYGSTVTGNIHKNPEFLKNSEEV